MQQLVSLTLLKQDKMQDNAQPQHLHNPHNVDDYGQHARKWRMFAPFGLVLIGCGASILGEAISQKLDSAPFWTWFWWGTAALVVLNAGVAVFGEAVKCRVLLELSKRA
jgi:hypothetical protein